MGREFFTLSELGVVLPALAQAAPEEAPWQIRRLGPEYEHEFLKLLLGLDQHSRQSRFEAIAGDDCLARHAKRTFSMAAFVVGAFMGGRLCGVVELYDEPRGGVCEVAFVVAQDWRRRGIGHALLQVAAQWAFQAGRTKLRMIVSPRNLPMRKLASKAGAQIDLSLDEILADVIIADYAKRMAFGSPPLQRPQ